MVSIIIPVFNRALLLNETIESIINQTYQNWEALFIDDQSTDDSINIINQYAKHDPRIKLFVRPDSRKKGANTCRNIGIEHAKRKYLIFLDSDDLLSSTCLELRVKEIKDNSQYDFIVFPGIIFKKNTNDTNQLISCTKIKNDTTTILDYFLKFDVPWVIFSPIWEKKSLEKVKLKWNENRGCFQDIEFHILAICKNLKFKIMTNVAPDSFWRRNEGIEHIGKSIATESNIQSTFQMLKDVFILISTMNLINDRRIGHLIKVNFHHVIYPHLRNGDAVKAKYNYQEILKYLKIPLVQGLIIRFLLRAYIPLACNKLKIISSPSYRFLHVLMKNGKLFKNNKIFLKCKYAGYQTN